MDTVTEFFGHLIETPFLYFIAVGVVLLICLYLVYAYQRAHRGIVPFKTQGGTIEIAPSTLRGVMQHAAISVDGVERASCRHFLRGRSVGVKIAIHLRANKRLKDVESAIKSCVRATLYDQFGMENIDPVHIRVTRIIGDPVAKPDNRYADEFDEREAGLLETNGGESDDDRPYADETRL